ncbi:MAG: hypothetical protein JOZ73_13440 [Solirubrobacterales bacterium]|nr:hypothetical protein [Solirubrobacterales bacterium]
MSVRLLAGAYAALRVGYAAAMLVRPAQTVRPWLGSAAQETGAKIAVRGLAARELALAAGVVGTVQSGRSPRTWLAACATSDAADLLSTILSDGNELPSKSKPGTLVAAGTFGAIALALALKHD